MIFSPTSAWAGTAIAASDSAMLRNAPARASKRVGWTILMIERDNATNAPGRGPRVGKPWSGFAVAAAPGLSMLPGEAEAGERAGKALSPGVIGVRAHVPRAGFAQTGPQGRVGGQA